MNLVAARLAEAVSLRVAQVEQDVAGVAAWASNAQLPLGPKAFSQYTQRKQELSDGERYRAIAMVPVFPAQGPNLAEQFVAGKRQEYDDAGYGAFETFPRHDEAISAPLIMIEPGTGRDGLFGYDIGSHETGRGAILEALKKDKPVLDGPYVLYEDRMAGEDVLSLLLYAPVQLTEDHDLPWQSMVVAAPVSPTRLLESLVETGLFDGYQVEVGVDSHAAPRIAFQFPDEGSAPRLLAGEYTHFATMFDRSIGGHKLSFTISKNFGFSLGEIGSVAGLAILLGAATFLCATCVLRLLRQREIIETELKAREAAFSQTERRLMRAEKLEALGEFVGGVAHDFNNILSVITFNAELLERHRLNQTGRGYLQSVVRSAERGASLSRQLLAFGRRSRLEPERSDVAQILSETAELFERLLPEHIEVRVSYEPSLWKINVDRNLLETSLLNLALNARHAMPDGGVLTLEAENFELLDTDNLPNDTNLPAGRYVHISVSDTGCGMDAEVAARAFEPFFTTKSDGEGNGMGLAMVLGFALQSGGTALVSSEVGVGTKVELCFPADETMEPTAGVDEAEQPVSDPSSILVLLVEDDAAVQEGIAQQLEHAGFIVATAENGDVALEKVMQGLRPTLVVSDVVMPGSLQGSALAESIRNIVPDIPFVFMSGYFEGAALGRNGRLPSPYLLQKPFSGAVLVDTIRQALDDD